MCDMMKTICPVKYTSATGETRVTKIPVFVRPPEVVREIDVWATLSAGGAKEGVVPLRSHSICTCGRHYYMVAPRMSMDLNNYNRYLIVRDPGEVASAIHNILYSLNLLHTVGGVVHRDIKPANIMVTGEGRVILTDFGASRVLDEPGSPMADVSCTMEKTTAWYLPPEAFLQDECTTANPKSDIFAVGCVAMELCLGRPLFREWNKREDAPLKEKRTFLDIMVSRCLAISQAMGHRHVCSDKGCICSFASADRTKDELPLATDISNFFSPLGAEVMEALGSLISPSLFQRPSAAKALVAF